MILIQIISTLVLVIASGPHIASAMGSKFTPELIDYCKNAGGTPKVFSTTMTDTCDNHLKRKQSKGSLTAGQALTAACDCGPQKCLQNDKCVINPD